jgi:hypothetical protein
MSWLLENIIVVVLTLGLGLAVGFLNVLGHQKAGIDQLSDVGNVFYFWAIYIPHRVPTMSEKLVLIIPIFLIKHTEIKPRKLFRGREKLNLKERDLSLGFYN